MKHLTAAWDDLAKTATTPRTWWHVTDNPKFALDPAYKSMTGGGEDHDSVRRDRGGLFLTPNPELWLYLWRYRPGQRMYAAEIKPASPPRMLGLIGGGDDRDQAMLSEAEAARAEVVRVVPVEEAIRQARKDGFGFAMLMLDAVPGSRVTHVVDHKRGFGSAEALCGGWGDGEPLKWTTKAWVLEHAQREYGSYVTLCEECLGKLKRQRT